MKFKSVVLLLALSSISIGCATDFSCGQFPSSGCQPVSRVIENTDGDVYDYREDLYLRGSEKSQSRKNVDRRLRNKSVLAPPKAGSPLLKRPQVLRIFLPQYIDADNDLNGSGYMFVRLNESEWQNFNN